MTSAGKTEFMDIAPEVVAEVQSTPEICHLLEFITSSTRGIIK